MRRRQQVLVGVLAVVVVGALAAQEVLRQIIKGRYQEAVASRQRLEQQFTEIVASHEWLTTNLQSERQRSTELTADLSSMRSRMEEAVGRLTEEARTTRELQTRLVVMQEQMDTLQGELVLALQREQEGTKAAATGPVQLERVIVSHAGSSAIQGRVVSIHSDWHFIVMDMGWNTVKIGDLVSIFRNEQLLAKARVERVQEDVSAATLLPEWESAEVRINDLIRVL